MAVLSKTCSQTGNNGFGKFFLGLILLACAGIGIYFLSELCKHAMDKHPEAIIVQECLDKGRGLGMFIRKSDQHIAFPCQTDDGRWGIKFDDQCRGENCSAFIKNKMKKAWQIVKYLQNTGYEAVDDLAKSFVERNPIPAQLLNDW
jgi:hypothetical protein